jgi:hypothetical protein
MGRRRIRQGVMGIEEGENRARARSPARFFAEVEDDLTGGSHCQRGGKGNGAYQFGIPRGGPWALSGTGPNGSPRPPFTFFLFCYFLFSIFCFLD